MTIHGIRFTWAELRAIFRICNRAITREGLWRARLNFVEQAEVLAIADGAALRQLRQQDGR